MTWARQIFCNGACRAVPGLIAFLLAAQALAQQSTVDTPSVGVWTDIGARSCGGRTWATTYDVQNGPAPDFCRPGSKGLIAVCNDKSCRYTTATSDQCRIEGGSGKAYRCEVEAPSAADTTAAVCSGEETAPWVAAGKGYSITVVIDGPTCASAYGAIVIRRPDGLPIWGHSVAAEWSTMFRLAEPQQVADTLKELLRAMQGDRFNDNNAPFTTGELREWPEGEKSPGCGWRSEVSQRQWNQWRAAKLPALVFMWGTEEESWYLLDEYGSVRKAGGHTPC
jgi:hypothetical protein